MSNNDYRVDRFKPNDQIFAKDLEGLRDSARGNSLQRTFRGRTVRTPGGAVFMPYQTSSTTTGGLFTLKIKSGTGDTYTCDIMTDTSGSGTVVTANVTMYVANAIGDLSVGSFWFCNKETISGVDRYVPVNVLRLF